MGDTGPLNYSSIASTSRTNRSGSSPRNEATTPNTASLKPPTFNTSSRSGAWVVVYACKLMHTSLGPAASCPCRRFWLATNFCHWVMTPVEPPAPVPTQLSMSLTSTQPAKRRSR